MLEVGWLLSRPDFSLISRRLRMQFCAGTAGNGEGWSAERGHTRVHDRGAFFRIESTRREQAHTYKYAHLYG